MRVQFVTAGTQLLSVGADGLIKLWNIHSNECINTFDQHTEKVWKIKPVANSKIPNSSAIDLGFVSN